RTQAFVECSRPGQKSQPPSASSGSASCGRNRVCLVEIKGSKSISKPSRGKPALQLERASSNRATGIFQCHSRNLRKRSREIIVVDDLQVEADARRHDAACAGGGQLQTVALLLFRLDGAAGGPAPDPASVNDETGAEQIG